ncbi:MAG: M15 family metallopeptidase [Patescibacteria group bacterium]|nr:M15 family metallopeptidase [Patescibacteria group bacterium]MDE1944482.1 M15 family metallopeptidase [Patescibacteria group bacterium]MDE1944713.1 M15 family metallopeptidase [Patescibacteria group bacterium]MDE2057257.1 M15 family metallopeptidase [Patescibacteria group bacterium]
MTIGSRAKRLFSDTHPVRALAAALALLATLSVLGAWYGHHELARLSAQVARLDADLASTTIALAANTAQTDAISATLSSEKVNVAGVSSQVAMLAKLQSLDPELLAKYSKVYFLNENYVPASLTTIPDQYDYFSGKTLQILPQVLPHLEAMLSAASSTGVALYAYSAYRSFDTQVALKKDYVVTFGAGTAGSFSADQGYSEHQLGTAVDLETTGMGGELTGDFAKTSAYQWLTDNAYKYGFTLSYPPGNTYYIFEPWHWRFVGIQLATYLHNSHQYFYDLDQRYIDSYLANIFD